MLNFRQPKTNSADSFTNSSNSFANSGTMNVFKENESCYLHPPHYANQYERYESKNRFVNPFKTYGNIFIDIRFSKRYITDRRPLEIF